MHQSPKCIEKGPRLKCTSKRGSTDTYQWEGWANTGKRRSTYGRGAIEILSFGSYTGKQELGGIRVWSGHQWWPRARTSHGSRNPCVPGPLLTPFSSRWERPNSEIKSCLNSSQQEAKWKRFPGPSTDDPSWNMEHRGDRTWRGHPSRYAWLPNEGRGHSSISKILT